MFFKVGLKRNWLKMNATGLAYPDIFTSIRFVLVRFVMQRLKNVINIFGNTIGQVIAIILAQKRFRNGWILILSCWGDKKRDQMKNYASYVEGGLLKDLESPFTDIIEQSIIGSDRFVDKIKREYLLFRSSDKNQEPGLVHLQQSFLVDEIINHVANVFKIKSESILQRRSKDKDARRLAMYCASNYCRHRNTLSDLATRFGVSVSALAQARDRVANNLSQSLQKKLTKFLDAIAK